MEQHHSVITSTIDKGALVLITGVNGYIASHTADQFLEAGYRVRGTVRSEDKAKWLYDLFDGKYGKGKFEAAVVADMDAEDAYDEAVKDVSGICHVASVVTFSDKPDEVIPPTVRGALHILTAATKEPSMKSLVYTSSSTAALMPQPDQVIHVTKDTWNQTSVDEANSHPNSWNVYAASKTEAERAVWQVVNATNPPFQVATILPNANIGPIIKPGGERSSSTASWMFKLFDGDADVLNGIPPQYYVDVRDTARLHVIALIDPSCNGQRIFAFAAPFNRNGVLAIYRKLYPNKTFPDDNEDDSKDLSTVPNDEAEALLRKHYAKDFTSLEESLKANTEPFVSTEDGATA